MKRKNKRFSDAKVIKTGPIYERQQNKEATMPLAADTEPAVTEPAITEAAVTDASVFETPVTEAPAAEDTVTETADQIVDELIAKRDQTIDAESEPVTQHVADIDDEEDEFEKENRKRELERELRHRKKNQKKLEKAIKRREKREKKNTREVLSYEDMPLEERAPEPKPLSKTAKKRITIAAIIIVIVGLAVFIFANADSMSFTGIKNFVSYGIFNQDSEHSFPIDVQGDNISNGNFTRIGQDLCYVSDTHYNVLNSYGRPVFTAQTGLASPVLVKDKKLSMVYSLGGTGYTIFSSDSVVYTSTTENSIFLGDIVDNGTYALITRDDGYNAKLYVYNKDNEQIYAYSFADFYITSMSLSSSGRDAVIAGVSALNGEEISCLYVLDFTKEEPKVQKELEENIIFEVEYLNDSYACVIGSIACYGMRVSNGELKETAYEGRTITAYDINPDTDNFAVSLSRSGDGRNCDILALNTNGSLANTISTDLRISSLSTYKNRVAALSEGSVFLYGKDSRMISETDAGMDPHVVVLYTSSRAYVLGTSEITTLDL